MTTPAGCRGPRMRADSSTRNATSSENVMIEQTLVKSSLDPSAAVYRKVVGAGDYWIHEIAAGRHSGLSTSKAIRRSTRFSTTRGRLPNDIAQRIRSCGQRNIYLTTGTVLRSNLGNPHAHHHGRHLRPARHAGRRLRAWRAIRCATRSRSATCTPAAAAFCWRIADPKWNLTKRDHRAQYQFLHERAGDAGGRAHVRGRDLGGRKVRRNARRDGRDLRHQQLSAAEQSVQRVQPDADCRF